MVYGLYLGAYTINIVLSCFPVKLQKYFIVTSKCQCLFISSTDL